MLRTKILLIIILSILLVACGETIDDADFLKDKVEVEIFETKDMKEFKRLIIKDHKESINEESIDFSLSSVYFDELGEYTVTVTYQDQDGNEGSKDITVNVVDTTPPVITTEKRYWVVNINAEEPDFLSVVSATDNYDGDITFTETDVDDSSFDISTEGEYYIQYSATDESGNKAILYTYVKVVDPSTEYIINFVDQMVVGKNESNPDYRSFIQSAKDQDENDLAFLGYTLEIDNSDVDLSTLGTYNLSVSIIDPDMNLVKTVNTLVEVKPQAAIHFVKNRIALYNNPDHRPEDLIKSMTDEYGKEIKLGTEYTLEVDKPLDVTTLGDQTMTYRILDQNDTLLCEETVTIRVLFPYTIEFKSNDLVVYYLDETFKETSLVKQVKDMDGNIVVLGTDYTLTTDLEIDVTSLGPQTIIYELNNHEGNVIYSEEVTITVDYFYDIILKDNLSIAYNDQDFIIENLITKVINAHGEEIDLSTGEFTLSTPRPIDVMTIGEQKIKLNLIKHEGDTSKLVYTEDVIIHVVLS
ncbi:hypothetical protein [Haloplasma contractile]|uniref:Hyalin protein n=1 Tax=Haloplasma contractile SSD-17B TaxID=1033810 RepID=U2E8E3_9MOLU|nr:hypothetical protein [Haloplasma contractile]ERJ11161.1 Hyalin protein [Haloplasma contractile SSD-17B]